MKTKISGARWSIDQGGTWLSFKVDSTPEARGIAESIKTDKEYTVEIKRYYEKRSRNANDLLWELCGQLSAALSKDGCIVSKEDVYRDHIRSSGVYEYMAMPEEAFDSFEREWSNKGIGWFTEKVDRCKLPGCVKVCVYYGSSTYTTAEMSRLLDAVIQTCDDCGVEVISPSELALIKEEWK